MINAKTFLRQFPIYLLIIGSMGALMSCGGSAYNPSATTGVGGVGGSVTSGNGSTTWTPPTTTTVTPGANFLPAESFSFTISGNGGTNPSYTTPAVNTDSILKVRINSGPASTLSLPLGSTSGQYSNFSALYGCIAYNITVNGQTVASTILSNGQSDRNCPNAPSSQVIDFSSRLTPGHGPLAVTVSNAQYDFYCLMYEEQYPYLYGTPSMYCPLRTVYKNHTVTGSIDIQVNGTSL